MLMILAVGASCVALLWAAFLVCGLGRRPALAAPPEIDRALPQATAAVRLNGREEDRIRPALDRSGAPIWVDADDLFWHDIVPFVSAERTLAARRSRARG
jgi:hypothetical protein